MNYRSIIRQELATQYARRGHTTRTTTDSRVHTHVSGSSTAWGAAPDTESASYEEQEAAFWSDSSDDDDMYACMF